LPELQRVFFCGEVMPCRTLNLWQAALPGADYVNMYGPTEITDVCTWYRVDRAFADSDSLPIGYPCANTRIHLIDGEICVSGTCLSPGYYGAPDKTAEAFVQNPLRPEIPEIIYKTGDLGAYNERGELLFLGRRDSQIKRNGYRIELGEIESAMNAADGVVLACCYYDADAQKIIGAYTGEAEEKPLRNALKAVLPKYMLPDALLRRESLPRTGSGKIDRLALRREVEHEHPIP
jgi:acyl-coenzyme A synthetase/AMP-(fatty) acid ligase